MKKSIVALCLFAAIMAGMAGGTLAYYSYEDRAHNVITSGGISIELVEKMLVSGEEVDFPEDGVEGVMPGDKPSKIVRVHNHGGQEAGEPQSAEAWVRVQVAKQVLVPDEKGRPQDRTEALGHLIHIQFDTKKWTQSGKTGEESLYYYKEKLAPGADTESLFKEVHFDTAMNNDYQNATVKIVVTAHAVQAANNGSTVLDATGWPG